MLAGGSGLFDKKACKSAFLPICHHPGRLVAMIASGKDEAYGGIHWPED
jgi:hypothetical protein